MQISGIAMKKIVYLLSSLVCVMLCACSSMQRNAPITDMSSMTDREPKQDISSDTVNYIVEPGDTLSQIARRSRHSVSELVAWNELASPDVIEVGQVLRVQRPDNMAVTKPVDMSSGSTAIQSNPVVKPAISKNTTFYIVETGDTLSSIARRSAHSVAELVEWNDLHSADAIEIGQKLRVQKPITETVKKENVKPNTTKVEKQESSTSSVTGGIAEIRRINWIWPTHGKIISTYTTARRGIAIGGTKGQKVVAAADGTVLHRGLMNGYGNLLIIKHSNNVLSVYAHNDKMFVKEKQRVKRGQQIAEMGNTDSEQVKLHFEIRYQGKPVDPTKYLPKQ